MFSLSASKVNLSVLERETITSGSANVYSVQFEFSKEWTGLTKTAVFHAADTTISVLLDDSNECSIPWEVLQDANRALCVGVYGTRGEDVVLPTIWTTLGTIKEGVHPGESAQPPTPSVYEQILADIGNLDELETTHKDSLVDAINELWLTGGGGGTGSGNVSSPDIGTIRVLDREEYEELPEKDPKTLYFIKG